MTGIATATQPEHASSRRRRMTRAVARRWPTGAAIAGAAASLALWAPLPHQVQTYVSAWCVLLAAIIYLTWGTARGDLARRPLLCAQTAGVLGFGAVAIAAVAATPSVGRFVCLRLARPRHLGRRASPRRLGRPPLVRGTCLVCDLIIAAALLAVG